MYKKIGFVLLASFSLFSCQAVNTVTGLPDVTNLNGLSCEELDNKERQLSTYQGRVDTASFVANVFGGYNTVRKTYPAKNTTLKVTRDAIQNAKTVAGC